MQYAQPEPDGLIFTSPGGKPLRQSNFRRREWAPALASAGLSGVHFHDLRHTGNTLSAEAGANVRELMDRMGHSSTRAAMVYLHSTGDRQRKIADALSDLARAELAKGAGSHGAVARNLAQVWHASGGRRYEDR